MRETAHRTTFAVFAAVLLIAGFIVVAPTARADDVTSLSLVNTNATGRSISLQSESTPRSFTGKANAADDTVDVLATFTSGTASVTVSVGAGTASASQPVVSGVGTPVSLVSGMNIIELTHVGGTTTTYTMRIHKGLRITGYEIINADDSTVIASRTLTPGDLADQDDTAVVPYGVSKIRSRMFYDTPTEASALPVEGLIWTGGVGSGFDTVASGQWGPIRTLNPGDNVTAFYPTVAPWSNYWGTAWNVRITREPAFNANVLESVVLNNGNASGGAVSLTSEPTPYLFTGRANAADDTIDVIATFSTGTASVTVALGSGAASTPESMTSGVGTPVRLQSGTNNIVVTHVGATTTTYTLRIHRGLQITGYEVINADDSTVIASRTFSSSDIGDQDDTASVPYGVSRIRTRMFYATPTEATALPVEGLIWTGCVGCSFSMVTSGEWSPPTNLAAGANNVSFYPTVAPWWNYWGTAWTVRITRGQAFGPSTLESLQLEGGTSGSVVSLAPDPAPYVYTGNANAVDDSINVLATFSTGTATARVALGAGSFTTPVSVQSGVPTPLPLAAGTNNVEVTHVGSTTTTYYVRIHRGLRITGFEIINADDSTVLMSKTGADFDFSDREYDIVFTHDVYRLRARMFYDTPTEATALPVEGLIWTGCVGCSFDTVASGEWGPVKTFNVGSSEINFYPTVSPWSNYWGTAWKVRVTRASAFASISNVSIPGVPPAGTPVNSGTALTATPVGLDGVPAPTVTYDWEATESLVNPDWELVETTTAPTWTPDNDVANQYVRVTATADNGVSTPVSRTSDPLGPIAEVDEAPRFRETGAISGTARVGSLLTVVTGRVTGRPTPAITHEWQIADDSQAAFAPIPDATGVSYTPVAADEGKVIRVVMRAANGIGTDAEVATVATEPVGESDSLGGGGSDDGAVPSAPRDVEAASGDASATVSWRDPARAGSAPVVNYLVTASPGGTTCLAPALTRNCLVTGLKNGSEYTFQVRALNARGWGPNSEKSNPVVPSATRSTPTIMITGYRADDGESRRVIVKGTTTGLAGREVVPYVKSSDKRSFTAGTSPRKVDAKGNFEWTRLSSRKTFVYFEGDGARSNRVVISAR
jgi:hypothetical protein